jgi:hypothetical protein
MHLSRYFRSSAAPAPEGSVSVDRWLGALSRADLVAMHEWAEPWPLLWTLTDKQVVDYVRRNHPRGPAAFLGTREKQRVALSVN